MIVLGLDIGYPKVANSRKIETSEKDYTSYLLDKSTFHSNSQPDTLKITGSVGPAVKKSTKSIN